MTTFKRGDVVVVPFPFTDLTTSKQRPAVVISPDAMNRSGEDVIIVAVTSHLPAAPGLFEVPVPGAELAAAGLLRPSVVRAGKLLTIHGGLIRKKIGALAPTRTAEVLAKVRVLFEP